MHSIYYEESKRKMSANSFSKNALGQFQSVCSVLAYLLTDILSSSDAQIKFPVQLVVAIFFSLHYQAKPKRNAKNGPSRLQKPLNY